MKTIKTSREMWIIVLVLLLTMCAYAQDETVSETSPDTRVYIIKEGDTLWDISGDVYQDPTKWPLLLEKNPQIKDPGKLQPGEKLYLETAPPPVKTEPEEIPTSVIKKIPEGLTLPPEVIPPEIITSEQPEKEFEIEPSDIFYIPMIIQSGFVSKEELEDAGYIDHDRDERKFITEDNVIFIKLPEDEMVNLKVGDKYTIFRVSEEVKHPITGKMVGYGIKVVGELQVTVLGRKTASAVVTDVNDVVYYNDRIRPFQPAVKTIYVKKGREPVVGYIVFALRSKSDHLRESMISENDIVYLDKGYADGIRAGYVFDILNLHEEYNEDVLTAEEYQKMLEGENADESMAEEGIVYPPDTIGQLVVISVEEYTSTAVVTRSNKDITMGSMVRLQIE